MSLKERIGLDALGRVKRGELTVIAAAALMSTPKVHQEKYADFGPPAASARRALTEKKMAG